MSFFYFQLVTAMGFQIGAFSTRSYMREQGMAAIVWTAQGTETDRTVNAAVRTIFSEKIITALPATAMR